MALSKLERSNKAHKANSKKKKYSLTERVRYYDNYLKKNFKINEDYKKPKVQYANGYLQAVERGAPLNLKEKSISYQKGVQAGLNAKRRAFSQRF